MNRTQHPPAPRRFSRACQAGLLALVLGTPWLAAAQQVSPRKVFGHLRQWTWTEQHGLPPSAVIAALRTRDGYVWLSTEAGVARFDGVQFTRVTQAGPTGGRLAAATAFLEDRAGSLWMATDGSGLVRWRDGKFTTYGTADGLPSLRVLSLLEDRQGALWVGTSGGLAHLTEQRFTVYRSADGLPSNEITAVTEDRRGNIWVGTRFGLARIRDGQVHSYAERHGLPATIIHALVPGDEGELWLGTNGQGVLRFAEDRVTPFGVAQGLSHAMVQSMLRDRDGAIWVGTYGGGLCRLAEARYRCAGTRDGLAGDRVSSITQHADGDIWLGTEGGLVQLKDPPLQVLGAEDGLAHDYVGALLNDRTGTLWVASVLGLNRYRDGRVTIYTTRDGLPSNAIRSIAEDRAGVIWFGGVEGLARYENGRFSTFTAPPGSPATRAYSILEDRSGRLWLGGHGVISEFRDGAFDSRPLPGPTPTSDVLAMHEDGEGSLWLGTRGGGLVRYRDGVFTRWTTDDGLSSDHIEIIHEDPSGSLWLGTSTGLNRFRNGRFVQFAEATGLSGVPVVSLVPDGVGHLWIGTGAGLYRAGLAQLNDVADGKRAELTTAAFGLADGLLSRDFSGASRTGGRAPDGHLWFATTRGLVRVRPERIRQSLSRTLIERVTVDTADVDAAGPVRIRATQKNLEIRYGALQWERPGAVAYRYRMLGLDRDWVLAKERRTAYYPYLPPGSYTFEVMADDGYGEWPDAAVRLDITAIPAFYQTWAFALATGAAGMALLGYAWRRRERTVRRQQALQHGFAQRLIGSQEAERQRIASELHDSLGQRLVVINNLALLAMEPSAPPEVSREQLRQISQQAGDALDEVTQISYNLRPYQLDRIGLTKAIEAVIHSASMASGVSISPALDDVDGLLSRDGEINLYRILQESLNNVVKHAQATAASVTVSRDEAVLRVTVQDNGRGFDLSGLPTGSGKGGFGLIGLRERATLLGGSLTIESAPGRGTRVHVDVPLAT